MARGARCSRTVEVERVDTVAARAAAGATRPRRSSARRSRRSARSACRASPTRDRRSARRRRRRTPGPERAHRLALAGRGGVEDRRGTTPQQHERASDEHRGERRATIRRSRLTAVGYGRACRAPPRDRGTPRVDEIDEPTADALVEITASALNPVDISIGNGRFYGGTPELPYVIGSEAVGRVGRRTAVWYYGNRGAMAERVACSTGAASSRSRTASTTRSRSPAGSPG